MDASDDCIGSHDQAIAGAAIDECRIIGEFEPARCGERREIAPDPLELARRLRRR